PSRLRATTVGYEAASGRTTGRSGRSQKCQEQPSAVFVVDPAEPLQEFGIEVIERFGGADSWWLPITAPMALWRNSISFRPTASHPMLARFASTALHDSRLITPNNCSQRHPARLRREWTTHSLFYSLNFLTIRGVNSRLASQAQCRFHAARPILAASLH